MANSNGMSVKLMIEPVIYADKDLNASSQQIGRSTCTVGGANKKDLFLNIEEKIWAMGGETKILDEQLAKEYNQWIADTKTHKEVPQILDNLYQRDLYFAIPYSDVLKSYLRKYN